MNIFKPVKHYSDITRINLASLKSAGKEALIIDLDETLIPKDLKDFSNEVIAWIKDARLKGFKICISSNSLRKQRVKKLAAILGIPFSALSLKPLPLAFAQALKTLRTDKEKTVMIGDQLFTDILGANLYGITSIFVTPLTPEKNPLRKFMRWLEGFFINLKP